MRFCNEVFCKCTKDFFKTYVFSIKQRQKFVVFSKNGEKGQSKKLDRKFDVIIPCRKNEKPPLTIVSKIAKPIGPNILERTFFGSHTHN